jgi:uncharacterized DUF497 family protein
LDDFDWDEGNEEKIWLQGRATPDEVEQVFFNRADRRRNGSRYIALGRTDEGRALFVVYERRDGRIRPISAREPNSREKKRIKGKQP